MQASKNVTELTLLCNRFRKDIISMLHSKQTGHPGGSLSAVEILSTLYFMKMNIDPKNPQMENRDRLILGKGHAAPILYIILAELGFFPKSELENFRQLNSILQGHPTFKVPGVEAVTGPLGMGLSVAAGMAAGLKLNKTDSKVYCVIGDGELQEGIVWETFMSASKFKQDNLICILDRNGVQLDGLVKDIMPIQDLDAVLKGFGWEVLNVDGHDITALSSVLDTANSIKGKPVFIIAKTIKGKGVSFMEHQSAWHGKPIDKESYTQAILELGGK